MSLVEYFSREKFRLKTTDLAKINSLTSHLLQNKPIQYFFGYTYFKGLKIGINSHVLIPRPETEELVDLVLLHAKKMNLDRIVDVGVGSGCIAIALKKEIKAQVLGIDCCDNVLSVASQNAMQNSVNIDLMLINVLEKEEHNVVPMMDIIVSNPPYVLASEVPKDSNIIHEPSIAIFVDKKNPLIFYRSILKLANKKLNVGGKIFFEINPNLVQELLILIESLGYSDIEIHRDFYDKKRFIVVSS